MPRPKGEPTKVVRLKAAWIEPYEAEAKRTGRPLTDVLAAAVEQALAATRGEPDSQPGTRGQAKLPRSESGRPSVPVSPRASAVADAQQAKAGVKPRLKGGKTS